MLLGGCNRGEEAQRQVGPAFRRAGADELHADALRLQRLRVIGLARMLEGLVGEAPVNGKRRDERLDYLASHAEMRVAPYAAVACAEHIPLCDVHAADVADFAVDDDYLAVVAPVDAAGQVVERHLEERVRVNAGSSQPLEESVSRRERPYMVIDYLDHHARACAFHEYVCNFLSEGVVREYVVLQVY